MPSYTLFSQQDTRKDPILTISKRLRETDIEFMRRLAPRANVIPVIAKADSLTRQEIQDFKQRVSTYSLL